jgi:hypothetical protein
MAHYLTNRGKLLLVQGAWDDNAAGTIRVGLLSGASVPAAITQANVNTLNTITDLKGLSGVSEIASAWYTGQGTSGRLSLSRSNASEDDTNNRVNLDAADLTWNSATAGDNICGGFVYDATTDTTDTTRQLMSVIVFASVIPTNGSNLTMAIADLYRAT